MDTDPYRPPSANLEAPKPPRGPPPRSVKVGVGVLLFSAVLAIAITVAMHAGLIPSPAAQPQSPGMEAAGAGLGLIINIFLAYKIYTGRNWARWVFSILWLLGCLGLLLSFSMLRMFGSAEVLQSVPWTAWAGAGVQSLIQLVAIVFMFLRESSKWFRQE